MLNIKINVTDIINLACHYYVYVMIRQLMLICSIYSDSQHGHRHAA